MSKKLKLRGIYYIIIQERGNKLIKYKINKYKLKSIMAEIKLTGAAKKLATASKVNAMNAIIADEVSVETAKNYCVVAEKVTALMEAGEEVVLQKVKNDPHTDYPETLTLVKYNTLNKITAKDKKGVEVALIRSERGKKNPKSVSNYFRISNSAAIYLPVVGIAAEGETEE